MDIMALSGGSGIDRNIMKKMMRNGKEAEDALAGNMIDKTVVGSSVEKTDSSMARNMVDAPRVDGKNYVKANLAGMQAVSAQQNRQDAILNSAINQIGNVDSNSVRVLAGKKAARAMLQDMHRTVQEESENNLKENRNSIGAAAEKAMNKDSAATPADAIVQGFTSAENVAVLSAAVSESAPVAPETSSSASVPTAPSVDITV